MENALVLIKKAREDGALVYVPQNLECPQLYKVEASVIEVEPRDFHEIEGKLVPRKEICDRIGDAAGVDFIAANCGVRTEMHDDEFGRRTVYIGYAQGRVRLSDGSWRQSSIEEYEFDPTLRAKAEGGGEKKVLGYLKVARQRASTGARLRVVRQLTGMPTAFEKAVIGQRMGLTFSRIVQNTDYILGTKEGKMMAIAMATGAANMLYGQRPDTSPEPGPSPAESFDDEPPMRDVTGSASASDLAGQALDDDPFGPKTEPTDPKLSEAYQALGDWANSDDKFITPRAVAILNRGEKDMRILSASILLMKYVASGKLKDIGINACLKALDENGKDPIVLEEIEKKARGAYEARSTPQAATS